MKHSWPVLSLFILLVTPGWVGATDEASAAVDRYFDAYKAMDLEQMVLAYAPDAEFIDVLQRHQVKGTDGLRELLGGLVAVHSEMGIEVQRSVVSGNLVAVDYLYRGTLSGEALKVVTGKETCRDTSYRIPVTTWFEIRGGRIQRQTDFIDLATLNEVKAEASGVEAQ
ncbi:MAG: nuclear transport factor 2 family protein [Acidobacteriota bacterium]